MKSEDFLGYLYVTGQLEFLGKEKDDENIVKCVNCDTELLVYEEILCIVLVVKI